MAQLPSLNQLSCNQLRQFPVLSNDNNEVSHGYINAGFEKNERGGMGNPC